MLNETDYIAEDDLLFEMPPPPPRRLLDHWRDVERIDRGNDGEFDPDNLEPPALRAIGSCVLGCICLFFAIVYVGLKLLGG